MPKLSISFKPNLARSTFKLGLTRIPQLRSKESCTGDRGTVAPGQVNMHCLWTCALMLLPTGILNQGGRLSLTPKLLDILPHCQLMRTTYNCLHKGWQKTSRGQLWCQCETAYYRHVLQQGVYAWIQRWCSHDVQELRPRQHMCNCKRLTGVRHGFLD